MIDAVSSFLRRVLDRWVLLGTAEARAEAIPVARRERVMGLFEQAATRLDGALGESGVPALLLARSAVPLYLEGLLVARAETEPALHAPLRVLWEGYDSAAAEGLAPILPAPLEVAREHTLDEASLDAQIAEHGERRIDETIELAAFLGTSIERRSVRRIRIERGVRKVIFAGILVMLVVEAIQHRPKTANLALHANVVASSRRPGSGPPANLTNGVPEPAASFATKDEPDPWVTIDLGPAARVSEVTLFDGSDHVDDILPMKLETSGDGTQWDPAAVETTRFTPEAPAVLTFTTRGVRFVRIHGRPNGAIYLSEVEVR